MDLTIHTAHDLIRIINAYPQWRRQVRESLFPEIDVPKAFQRLADAQERTEEALRDLSQTVRDLSLAQRRTEQTVKELVQTQQEMSKDIHKLQIIVKHHTTRLGRIDKKLLEAAQERQAIRDDLEVVKRGQEDLRHEVKELRRGQDELKRNQNDLRGESYERKIRDRADAIFGRFLKRGRKMRNEIGEHLEEAQENDQLVDEEHDQVLACDLLWGGKLKKSGEELFLVIEASCLAEEHDIQRAYNRANILRSIGIESLPVVAAINWTPEVTEQAFDLGVVVVNDTRLDKASWQAALA